MTSSSRVFISYAHRDGAQLAERIHDELLQRGFEPWLDRQRLEAGASWSIDIETALDHSDVVLALVSDGSYRSEICRAEQLRSLRKGACVIPVLVHTGADIPLFLEARQYVDSHAPDALDVLVTRIRAKDG